MVLKSLIFGCVAAIVVVTQADIELASESVELAKDDTKRILQVALKGEGQWTATTDVDWITMMRTSGTETTLPFYRVSHNYSTDDRTGVITVNGMAYTVVQKGYVAILDSERVTVPAVEMTSAASISFETETAADGSLISWSARSDQDWVTITPVFGTADTLGHGTVFYRVSANESNVERLATLTIAGQRFVILQEAASTPGEGGEGVKVSLSPSELTLPSGATERQIEVVADTDVTWKVVSDVPWVTVNVGSGHGNGILGVAVAQNPSVLTRRCEVTVGDNALKIIQKGTTDYLIGTMPLTSSFPYNGRTDTIDVQANDDLSWTVTSKDPWITFPPGGSMEKTGTGPQSIQVQTSLNSGLSSRTGTVEVAAHIPYPEIEIARGLTLWRGENQNGGYSYNAPEIRDPEIQGETEGVWFVLNDPAHMNSLHRLFDLNGGAASLYVTTENRLVCDMPNGDIVDLSFPVEVNVKYDLFLVSSSTNTVIYGGTHDAGAYRQLYVSDIVLAISDYGHTTKPSEDWLVWGETSRAYYNWSRALNIYEMVNVPQEIPAITVPNESCYETLYNSFSFNGFRVWCRNKKPDGRIYTEGVQYTSDRHGLRQNAMTGNICYNTIACVGVGTQPLGFDDKDKPLVYDDRDSEHEIRQDVYGKSYVKYYYFYRYYHYSGDLKEMQTSWSNLVEGNNASKSEVVTVNMWVKFARIGHQRADLFEILRLSSNYKQLNGKDFEDFISRKDKYKLQFSDRGLTLVENGILSPDYGSEYINDREWVMLTMTSNGSKLTLYINGVDVGNVQLNGSYNLFCPDCWSCYGDGNVVFDEVKTFTSCLSTEQIVQMYNLEKPLKASHVVVQETAVPSLSGEQLECSAKSGNYSVALTLPNRIKWTAESNESWIHVVTTNGTGSATISFAVDKNVETHDRVGSITIAGLTYTVCQKGTGVSLSETVFMAAFDGSDLVEIPIVADDQDTHWTVSIVQNLQGDSLFPMADDGIGSDVLGVFVGECLQEAFSQIGIVEVSGQRAYIVQRDFDLCISPVSTNFTWRGGDGMIDVVTEDVDFDIWQTVSDSDWIRITAGGTGSGNGCIRFSVEENTTGKDRVGRIIVSGEICEIVQKAPGVLTGLEIDGPDSLMAGGTTSYDCFLVYSDGDRRPAEVEWVLPSSTFAQISGNGVFTAGTSAGEVTINALYEGDGLSLRSAKIVQILNKPVSLTIGIGKTTVCVNDRLAMEFVVTYADGTSRYVVPDSVRVESGNAEVEEGAVLVIGNQPGSVSLSANYTLNGINVTANKGISVRNAITCEEALGSNDLTIVNSGIPSWMVDTEVAHDEQFSLVSKETNSTHEVKLSVNGAGNFSCWMKSSAFDADVAIGQVLIDGALIATLHGNTDWTNIISRVSTFGGHEIIVRRLPTSGDSSLWLDDISWTPIAAELESVYIDGGSRLVDGRSTSLICRATYTDGNVKIISPTWSVVVGTACAVINSIGQLTATKPGTVTVKASYTENGITQTSTLFVQIVKALTTVVIDGPRTVYAGDSAVYSCVATYTDGSSESVNANWQLTSGKAYAVMNSTGVLTAQDADGTATVKTTFTYEGESKSATSSIAITRQVLVNSEVTGTKTEYVPVAWVNQYPSFRGMFGKDLSVAMSKLTGKKDGVGKSLNVWDDYLAGTDPTDVSSVFYANIDMVEGVPSISWNPNLNTNGTQQRLYTIMGKKDIANALLDWHPAQVDDRFFKVIIEMPDGIRSSDAPGKIEPSYTQIAVPSAKTGLSYTGKLQTGVNGGAGYTITGHQATDAGNYTAVVTLEKGYKWDDGTLTSKSISWSIAKAKNLWNRLPSLSAIQFDVGSTVSVDNGSAKYGTVSSSYSSNQLKSLAAGSYTIVFSVPETSNYSSLSKSLSFTVKEPIPFGATYCVVDLSGGASASSYPVTYMDNMPTGGWTDEYKTTKLVMKRIEAGSFIMGGDQLDESHRVTLTKAFYVGVFEVTQKQWELVMGRRSKWVSDFSYTYGAGDTFPAHGVYYAQIRGSVEGALWPTSSAVDATSFLGKLRERTGLLDVDLPTEAQWEYACRAGTTTDFCYGDSINGDYMWYVANSESKAHPVGMKTPNQWGIYDMHGNVAELCLDWSDLSHLTYGIDPLGPASPTSIGETGVYRISRGGSFGMTYAVCDKCKSFVRSSTITEEWYPGCGDNYDHGFRVVMSIR